MRVKCESLILTTTSLLTTSLSTTTTAASKPRSSILILHTNPPGYPYTGAVITDSSGKAEYGGEDFDFVFQDDTEVFNSCSVTYRGEFYVFGGKIERTQISKVKNCSLQRIGSLSFNFSDGGCAAVNENAIYLCFDWDDTKQCHVGTDPVGFFSKIPESQFAHDHTRVAANEGKL